MELSSWENHLFLWAIYTMAMLNNQMVYHYITIKSDFLPNF
jgi:hypothetical protein